jgi:aldose 1-epimerase
MIELVDDAARVTLAPEIGGSIVAFTWRGRPVLRPTPASALDEGNVRLASCYPLVPWSNRIRNAVLSFAGRTWSLARNFGSHPHAIHGVGWQRSWHLEEALPTRARLSLVHDARDPQSSAWPWPFRATQTFELHGRAHGCGEALLGVTLTLENLAAEAFPFGLGWHPFFPKSWAARLAFGADGVWENDATQLPVRHIAIPPRWGFDGTEPLSGVALDNVFTHWQGVATLDEPATGTRMALAVDRACRYLVVYSPPGADFIALEPVTHETDAFNRAASGAADTGIRTLAPGAAFSCTMRVAASALD